MSFIISPFNEYSWLISFKADWFDLLAVQGTVKGLLQRHSSKASVLWHSAFCTVQVSQPYVAVGKTRASTIRTFVSRVTALLFNTLSTFVTAFLPRSSCLISWLQSPSTVILEPKKMKSVITSIVTPSICHEVMGPDAMIVVFFIFGFKPAFSLSYFTLIERFFSFSLISAVRVVSISILRLLMLYLCITISNMYLYICHMYDIYNISSYNCKASKLHPLIR